VRRISEPRSPPGDPALQEEIEPIRWSPIAAGERSTLPVTAATIFDGPGLQTKSVRGRWEAERSRSATGGEGGRGRSFPAAAVPRQAWEDLQQARTAAA